MGPALASDGSGGAYLAWQEQRDEYRWMLGAARFDAGGARSWGGVTDVDPPAASVALTLRGPWPNPSHGPLTVDLSLPRSGAGALELVDLAGRRVASRTLTGLTPGPHTLTLDGRSLASGLYFVRVTHDGHTITRKVCLLR
jgi:hypothetical protein